MKEEKFKISKRLKSFTYAFNGLKILIKEEHNARIHVLATVCVVILGILLKITILEWIAVIFAIGLVISSEIFNSAIENIADYLTKEKREEIKRIKDLAAAGVLICAIAALIIGLLIFIPKIIEICNSN
ncbi:diacylglycerol kinase [Flammeovirga yaeyamensis]|uniref:Diacylglycerol kinase n=1 Tax=Flammeovirga yaeyamensis TaxID=367791 RepID=A0AAX1NDM5_9BACT|nr:diacylglycerol kinase family protein [Flammeovirga yaeyamensis]MBB3696679.1 diacylglycerol kinase [Flammeovirga yaeyamensis]NMF33352.1 diacylglycerol kinase family protein [Flammeovirga yaeyamensis]QWG05372.1 diacylglycerol kinase [Flammeovirga yaeyamensis]